jgi:hypothetical protein
MKTRFRPTLRQFRIQEAISLAATLYGQKLFKEWKKSARLNWFLLALAAAYAFKDVYQYITF